MKKQYAVLGLGRFGSKVARELFYRKQEVIVIDNDENKIQAIKDEVTNAFLGDISDEQALLEAGVADCDIVVIAESTNVEANIIATQICKNIGVKKVICKAKNTIHGNILKKLNADIIVFPEQDTAIKIVNKLTSEGILDYFELGGELSIVGITAPADMINKTFGDLDLRKKFNVTILGIKRGEGILFHLTADTKIVKDDVLIVFGESEALKKLHLNITHKT
ncbi:MAG: TrkA family potassium uptake protein [bacterium]